YLINIKLEGSKKSDKNAEISKSELLSIKNKLFKANPDEFPPSSIAYDGESNLFSSVQLPVSKFSVELHRRKYTVSIEFKKNLELTHLWGHPIPEELLHGLNIIIKEDSLRQRIKYGQGLYSRSKDCAFNIGRGITALQGTRQAFASTLNGLVLRVDSSAMPFHKPGPVLQFLEENLRLSFKENTQLSKQQRIAVENALRDLQVTVTHRKTSEKFTIIGLTRLNTVDITFSDDGSGKEVNLVEYYRNRYKIEFKFKKLPCLDLSTKSRMNYVPIELCELAEGQRYPRDGLRKEEEKRMRDMALTAPAKRQEMILKMVSASDGPCRGELARRLGISLVREMTEVRARVLERPSLRLRNLKGQCYRFKNWGRDAQWNPLTNKLLRGQKLENWAILDFSAAPACPKQQQRLQIPAFVQSLVRRCRDLGIQICESPAFVNASAMAALSNYRWLAEELSKAKQSPDGRAVQLLICAMSDRHPGYKSLKLICETELGVVTQCCLSFHANNARKRDRDRYLANLALKINAKIGGTNPRIGGSRFMLIGADVNHPPCWNTASPSIAAVVATLDHPQPHTYTSRVRCQPHRVEQIVRLGEMCSELAAEYARINKARPEKIIYFRDGVGDSQFDMVLNKEVRDLESAVGSDGYSPTITVVVAQKRHHTRLFPKDGAGSTRSGNVPPGTVVDTGIVDPLAFDFYLCSHYGSRGTSKPTHYHVLRDDHGFTSDELQRLVYNLCFTFARCTKPVSLVPPVYYADLVAYRARMYFEGMSDLQSPTASTASASASASSTSASASLDHFVLPKIHEKVDGSVMY
ncbi:protein argonaute 2, partial [Ananas comosus]|uniref:Protein argonaute 2 n=1 Tax=Ananas comosus TaxID=4615 RepID=A0A6P5FF67_ANACO